MKNWELEYKVRWERRDDGFHCSDWENEDRARRLFERLKNEKVRCTIWAELCYASIADDAEDEVVVVDAFERRVIDLMGHKVVV